MFLETRMFSPSSINKQYKVAIAVLNLFSFWQYLHFSWIERSVFMVLSTTCFLKALLQFLSLFVSTDFQAQSLWRVELLQYDLKQISSNSLQVCLYPKCKSEKAQYDILALLFYRVTDIWHMTKRHKKVCYFQNWISNSKVYPYLHNKQEFGLQRIFCITGIYSHLTDLFNSQQESRESHINPIPRPSQWRTVQTAWILVCLVWYLKMQKCLGM